jgi:hypothetical protein
MTDELDDQTLELLVLDAACRRWGRDVQAIHLRTEPHVTAHVRLRPDAQLVNITITAVEP